MGKFLGSKCELVAIVALLAMGSLVGESRGQDTSCINQLVPCLNYLNGTKDVPKACCDPLQNVIKSDPECLCSMVSNQASNQAEQAGINIAQAQQLPARCGLHVNPLSCLSGSNNKNSVDNSSGELLFGCWRMMVAIALSAVLQILLCSSV